MKPARRSPRPAGLVPLAAFLGLLASSAQAAAPEPGLAPQLMEKTVIEVGHGRRIHAACLGAGSPTVLFEPGGEGSMLSWRKVQPAITSLTRTCFYDRAGMGYSDPPGRPVTAFNVTDEMRVVLARLKVKGPVVLVGHSIGGFYATVFADRFPRQVAGLVLIDPGFAGQVDPRPPESLEVDRAHIRTGEAHLLDCAARARAGTLSPTGDGCMAYPPPATPAEGAYLAHIVTHPFWYEAEHDQSRRFFLGDAGPSEDTLQARRVARRWPGLPVVVVSASDPPMRAWNSPAAQAAQRADWQAGHRALAARSDLGQWRIVPNSDHFVQLSQPAAVIEAVRQVVLEARSRPQGRAR